MLVNLRCFLWYYKKINKILVNKKGKKLTEMLLMGGAARLYDEKVKGTCVLGVF